MFDISTFGRHVISRTIVARLRRTTFFLQVSKSVTFGIKLSFVSCVEMWLIFISQLNVLRIDQERIVWYSSDE